MKFRPVVQEMSFKDISYLELWQPMCSVDWNHLYTIGRRHHEKQSCKNILHLDQWFRRKCRLKVFLIWSSGSLFVQRSVNIFVELQKRVSSGTILWIYFEFGLVVQEM